MRIDKNNIFAYIYMYNVTYIRIPYWLLPIVYSHFCYFHAWEM